MGQDLGAILDDDWTVSTSTCHRVNIFLLIILYYMYIASQPAEEAKPVGAYRPPAYRAPGRRGPPTMGKSKTPEIDSEIAFPSLSASMASAKGWVLLEKRLSYKTCLTNSSYWWHTKYMYSLNSPYGHLYNIDTSLLRTVHLVPEMPKIIHSLPL